MTSGTIGQILILARLDDAGDGDAFQKFGMLGGGFEAADQRIIGAFDAAGLVVVGAGAVDD